MFKSILAVSEGGPDAAMSFKLAARVAGVFDSAVDALHLPVGPAGGMVGGLAMSGEAMPLVMNLDDERLEERAKESERAYKETLALIKGATYTAAKTATLDAMVAMGRCSDILVLGRPGADPENVAPATVEAALARHPALQSVVVVAQEVGKLAESSAQNAKQIADIVEQASQEAQQGKTAARTVGDCMVDIEGGTGETTTMIRSIAVAMDEHQATVAQIEGNVTELKTVALTNSSSAEEIAATMIQLSKQSNLMRQRLAEFSTT